MLRVVCSRRIVSSVTKTVSRQALLRPSLPVAQSLAQNRIWLPRTYNGYATEAFEGEMNDYEKFLSSKLIDAFEPSELSVRDVSGGCGSMFAITIVSKAFSGISMVKQHRMVNDVLSDEIKQWHGVQLKTKAE
ncbi:bola protein [Lipomyces arxii]|uniref:bola protein n=1 Tax=Lipomyces arxii TaxID=56418 RepID=UPI0034CE3CED